jgi:hypothetical protein
MAMLALQHSSTGKGLTKRVFTLDRIGYPGFRSAKQLLADVVQTIEK